MGLTEFISKILKLNEQNLCRRIKIGTFRGDTKQKVVLNGNRIFKRRKLID